MSAAETYIDVPFGVTDPDAWHAWRPADLASLIAAAVAGDLFRRPPTIGIVRNGGALLYEGAVNGLAGPSGTGKTMFALSVAAEVMAAGGHVLFVDYEDTATSIVLRLINELQVDPEHVRGLFHYVNPSGGASAGVGHAVDLVRQHAVRLVVVDSVGEALAAESLNPNADEDVARWFQTVPRPLAEAGAAVLVLDHQTKAADDGTLWPIGSQRKRAAISGAQYVMTIREAFSRSKSGAVRVLCAKDRHGHYAHGQHVADITFDPRADGSVLVTTWSVQEPAKAADGQWRPTALMEAVSAYLAANDGTTKSGIAAEVTGKREHILRAVHVLTMEGYVSVKKVGTAHHLHLVRPYSIAADEVS